MRISILCLLAACAAPPVMAPAARARCGAGRTCSDPRDRIAIAIAERGESGTRLVAIDEHGDRQLVLVRASQTLARDTNPAISPDGKWIVFASSRDRAIDETNLWIAPLAPDAVPTRLTRGTAIDSHPVWRRDGSAIVFASTRAPSGMFVLYELAIDAHGAAVGEPRPLTPIDRASHAITPAVAADGTIIYAAITPQPDGQVESHLEERAPDGSIRTLTAGPADTSPALSPDGTWIVFARPQQHRAASPTASSGSCGAARTPRPSSSICR